VGKKISTKILKGNMEQVYIAGAARTAIGSFGGVFKNTPAVTLGSFAVKKVLKNTGIGCESIDEVIMGNVLQAGLGQNTCRQVAIESGIPFKTCATTVNKVCGSGLASVVIASQIIRSGDAECIMAGGIENMSQAPYLIDKCRWGAKMGNCQLIDEMISDGLWDVFGNYHMGITAENIAQKYSISRDSQDEFAFLSQLKTKEALSQGKFDEEIAGITVTLKKGEALEVVKDEYPRPDTTIQRLSALSPAFKKDGTVTAGNSSGINDGAAAVLVASENFIKKNNLVPMAKILSHGSEGVDPAFMGMGPVPSVRIALKKAGLDIKDIDLAELNEAFAVQALAVIGDLGINPDIVNVNGGAIALGHPIGASGARILVTLLYEMKKREVKYGLASLCIGGGMGEALIVCKDRLCQ